MVFLMDDGILELVIVDLKLGDMVLKLGIKITHKNKVYNSTPYFYFISILYLHSELHNFMR